MPREIVDSDQFIELSKEAIECRIKVIGDDTVKFKLRTDKYLYTLKVEKTKAEEVKSKIKCSTIEIE